MGLAPYARKHIFDYEPFRYENGRVFLNYDWMRKIDPYKGGKYQCFYEYFQYYTDLAYFAQYHLEKEKGCLINPKQGPTLFTRLDKNGWPIKIP